MKTRRVIYFSIDALLFWAGILCAQDLKSKVDSVNAIPYQYIVSNTRQSIKIFSENLNRAREIRYLEGEAKTLSNLGLAYYLRGDYDKSTENYLSAISIYENKKDYKMLAETYGEYGYQLKRRDLNKAVNYMRRAIGIAERENLKPIDKSKLYDNYGVLKEMQNDLDSAMYFYNKALKIKKGFRDSIAIPYSLNKIAGIKIFQKEYNEALKYLKLSDGYRKNEVGDFGRSENYLIYGYLYYQQGDIDSAIISYEKCLELSKKLGYKYQIQESYQNLIKLYKSKKEYLRALLNYENYITYKDSVNNFETNALIAQLEIDYETANKDKIIVENELSLKQKSLQLYLVLAVSALVIVISGWYYKNQKLKSEKEKKELELKNQLNKAEMGKKLGDEKLKLSRELHDNIGSQLTFVISSLDNIVYQEKNIQLTEKLKRLGLFSRETLSDLRNTIWAIKHEDGDLTQLIYKVNELILKLNQDITIPQILLTNRIDKSYKLSSTQMLNIFRIIQEAIQNTLKHASATEINVEFSSVEDRIILTIRDNGKGFDLNKLNEGSGLDNMKSRCEEASGELKIESGANGTTIECIFKTD